MNIKCEGLYILLREFDLIKLQNCNSDCFCLVPELGRQSNINISFPNPLETCKFSKKHLLTCEEIIKDINQIVNNKIPKNEILLTEELLKPFLDARISIYLYLNECIPEYKTYNLIVDGKWKRFNSKTNLIIGIEKEYFKEEGTDLNSLGKFTKSKYSFLHKLLARFQVLIIKKLINQKKIYVLSGKNSYFMPIVFRKLSKERQNIIVYSQTQKLIKITFIILRQLKSIIFNRNLKIEFFMIPFNISESRKIKIIKNIKKYQSKIIDHKYFNYILKDVENYLNVNKGYRNYNKKLFGYSSIKYCQGIFHTNRLPDLNSLSFILSKLNGKLHLITHGTHTLKSKSEQISESLEIGMIISHIPKMRFYSQSLFSDDYFISKNISSTKIKPIKSISLKKEKINSPVLKILSAGTVKQLGARRYYFESCFEYIYSILELCEKFQKLNFEIELTIRIRDVKNEINHKVITNLLQRFNGFVKISKNKNFEEDLLKADCLIALSSTTLEQALNSQIPSMSYGLSAYNHFDYYRDNKYRINNKIKNFDKLRKIEDILERRFIYLEQNILKRNKTIFDYIF